MSELLLIPSPGPADEADLWRLWRQLLDHLLRELEAGQPSAAIMDVARKFLKDNGAMFDQTHKVDPRKALQTLAGMDLPFPTTKQ